MTDALIQAPPGSPYEGAIMLGLLALMAFFLFRYMSRFNSEGLKVSRPKGSKAKESDDEEEEEEEEDNVTDGATGEDTDDGKAK